MCDRTLLGLNKRFNWNRTTQRRQAFHPLFPLFGRKRADMPQRSAILLEVLQVGWYENLHKDEGAYSKDIEVEVMTPVDLAVEDRRELIDRKVNMRRFQRTGKIP